MDLTSKVPLDPRLRAILRLSRKGKIPADIGSDHSYIPFHLLQQEDCKIAVAADLNQGPLDNAAKNAVIEQGYDPSFGARPLKRLMQRKIETLLAPITDSLCNAV